MNIDSNTINNIVTSILNAVKPAVVEFITPIVNEIVENRVDEDHIADLAVENIDYDDLRNKVMESLDMDEIADEVANSRHFSGAVEESVEQAVRDLDLSDQMGEAAREAIDECDAFSDMQAKLLNIDAKVEETVIRLSDYISKMENTPVPATSREELLKDVIAYIRSNITISLT